LKQLLCPGFLLLLIVSQKQAMAKPVSSLQSLSMLLDEELEHPLVSEERHREQDDSVPIGAFDQEEAEFPWTQITREQPVSTSTDSAVQRLLSDLLGLPWRYQNRSKKGLSRSCFGVKLDRIGSMSGLGC
ncbi:ANFC protein, partial [Odontophorus gujanensis]|nr:ANFC protein [Odontophorus gujanensis]